MPGKSVTVRPGGPRQVKLSTNLIYDAALDDELFDALPSIVAGAVGARSCVLHWRGTGGAVEIFTHSGYFSDADMANYATNFASHDLWTDAGMRQGYVNKAWRTSDLVATTDYERSIFYNEWIRTMGDDTFYCCGSVMETAHGQGCVGLHRGKSQADFAPVELGRLNGHIDPLRRMFAMRARLSGLSGRHDLLDSIFAAGREAAFVIGRDRRLQMANAAGDAMLRAGRFLRARKGLVESELDDDRPAFERALAEASARGERHASDCLLRSRGGAAVAVSLLPLSGHKGKAAILATVAEPRNRLPRELVGRHLARIYRMSAAETDVALRLADGQSIGEISEARGSAVGTVRIQVKHILSKMDARRQADVVRMVVAVYHQP